MDTWPGVDGVALADTFPAETHAFSERQLSEHGDGWCWPLPAWDELEQRLEASVAGIDEDGLAAFRAQATPHPFGTFKQALKLTRPDAAPLPKLGILNSFTEAQLREWIAAGHAWVACLSGPEWHFVDLPTGHWPMFSEPVRLAAILHDAAQSRHTAWSEVRTA